MAHEMRALEHGRGRPKEPRELVRDGGGIEIGGAVRGERVLERAKGVVHGAASIDGTIARGQFRSERRLCAAGSVG